MCSFCFLPITRRPRPLALLASLCQIDQEFRMNFFLGSEQLQPLHWGPFCHLGQKCNCVAPGKKASKSQTPVSHKAPSLPPCTDLSVLCPALYSLDRKKEKYLVLRSQGLWRASLSIFQAAGNSERAESLDSGTIGSDPNSTTDFVIMGNTASVSSSI